MNRAWLYCTFDLDAGIDSDVYFLGEVTDEGSLRDLVKSHCEFWDDTHADHIHLIVEGTPEHAEMSKHGHFPYGLPDTFRPRAVAQ